MILPLKVRVVIIVVQRQTMHYGIQMLPGNPLKLRGMSMAVYSVTHSNRGKQALPMSAAGAGPIGERRGPDECPAHAGQLARPPARRE